jgi:UDP-N-acetylmuramyl pentapeptide phosphotransferase/UDP-N-acetylglucosamine-1-phosphate transferase
VGKAAESSAVQKWLRDFYFAIMFRFFKELYYTCFTLFFKAGRSGWSNPVNVGKGVAGVAAVEWVILTAIAGWIGIFCRSESFFDLGQWAIGIAFLILCSINHYVLVMRGHGIRFEREFNSLKKSKRIFLLVNCTVVLLVIIGFFIVTVSAFQRFFHITPKSGF